MGSLTIDPRELMHDTRQADGLLCESSDQKDLYRRISNRISSLQVSINWPQRVFAETEAQASEPIHDNAGDKTWSPNGLMRRAQARATREHCSASESIFSDLPKANLVSFERFVTSVAEKVTLDNVPAWNKVFAYTDFDSYPLYVSLLTLAATEDDSCRLPARRVFAARCKKTMHSLGLADKLIDQVQDDCPAEPKRELLLRVAHMMACLEEQVATDGYLQAAIHFEKLNDIRSALACVYRNVRYRLRDGQIANLDDDIRNFVVEDAGVETMLAVLTATAPVKRQVPSRKLLYRSIRRTLKNRGQLEAGLLDGLR